MQKIYPSFNFADICAGIGGFRLGLEHLGGRCVFSCEIDKQCEKTYIENFGEGYNVYDVYDVNPANMPNIDMLCAGFPCQPFSIAGKRKGIEDVRGQVFFQILAMIETKKPATVLLENVPNLLTLEKGETIKTILKSLQNLGYTTHYKVLDSAYFGVAQSRPRLFILAFLTPYLFQFTEKRTSKIPFKQIIEKGDNSIPISEKWQQYIDLYSGKIPITDITFDVPKTRQKLERIDAGTDLDDCVFQLRTSGIRALNIDKPLPTFAVSISGGGAMIPVYSKERRHLSLLEMRRLMGFPDDFRFPVARTHAIKQLANAVCPPVIRSIGQDILQHQVSISSLVLYKV